MDSLKLSVLTPHSYTDGCRCRECFGLAEFMLQATGSTHGLPRLEASPVARKSVLSVVDTCTGTMTCECPVCSQERSERMSRPRKRVRQPWELEAA